MIIDNKEVFRYAGLRSSEPDDEIKAIVEEIKQEALSVIVPKYTTKKVRFKRSDDGIIIDGGIHFISKGLLSHLKNSEFIILLAVTLGIESDSIIRRNSAQGSLKAILTQAVLTAAIESFCDEICEKIAAEEMKNGFYLRPRFSPGYSDMALSEQKNFFEALEITKRIGITLNDEFLMLPTKSVTAFIGLTKDEACSISNCINCEHKECGFRKGIK